MKRVIPLIALCLALASCSTTRVLKEGEYRLKENTISVNDSSFNTSQMENYIRQDPGGNGILGWNPLLYVYNFSKRDGFWHKLGTAPVIFNEAAVGTSLVNMENRLNYTGYYGSKVDSTITRTGKEVSVNYDIKLGRRYLIDRVVFDVPGYESFRTDFYADTSTVMAALRGQYLSESILEAESVRAAARLREIGYYGINKNNFSFEADTSGTSAILHYRVREYERGQSGTDARPLVKFHIGKVSITRPRELRFRESLLRSLNMVHPGDVYSESAVNSTYERMSSIKAFGGVSIEMSQSDSAKVDCAINITQSPAQGFKVNLEGSTNSSGLIAVSPQLNYFNKNIFSGGEWLNLGFSGNFQFSMSNDTRATEFGVTSGISFPRLLGIPFSFFQKNAVPRTDLNMAFNYQDRPEYTRNIFSVGFGYSGVTRNNISYQIFPLQLNFVRLYNLDSKFSKTLDANPFMRYSYQDHLDAGVGLVLYYNSSTDIVPQSSYYFHRLAVDLSGNLLSLFSNSMKTNADGAACIAGSPFAQYVRGEYSIGRTWRYSGGQKAIATRFLIGAGYAYGNSSALPFEKQFYAGGASSMRGWQARALGPGYVSRNRTFSIPSQTGDIKLEANIEYRFNLFWKFEGALFADAGNVWNLRYEDTEEGRKGAFLPGDFYNSLGADWGLGLRVNLNFLLVRVDFGMKLRDPSRSERARLIGPDEWFHGDGNALHFGIGYPF